MESEEISCFPGEGSIPAEKNVNPQDLAEFSDFFRGDQGFDVIAASCLAPELKEKREGWAHSTCVECSPAPHLDLCAMHSVVNPSVLFKSQVSVDLPLMKGGGSP